MDKTLPINDISKETVIEAATEKVTRANIEAASTIASASEVVSNEQAKKSSVEILEMQSMFSGPIPPPELFEAYEKVLPGSAERILALAERQSAHRQKMEEKVFDHQGAIESKVVVARIQDAKLGLIFGFLVCLATIGGGVYCVALGKEIAGSIIGSGGLIGLVSVFVYGSIRRHDKKVEKELVQQKEEKN